MDYYNEIKNELLNNEVYKSVKDYSMNRGDLLTYYNVGKLLIEAQGGKDKAKYGDGLIKEYSKKLTNDLGKKFNTTLLKNIRQFYLISQKSPTLSDRLTWSHYVEVLYLRNIDIINYYINVAIKSNLSVRELRNRIKNNEYERLDEDIKKRLVNNNENNQIQDFIKHPILIKNSHNYQEVSEKILKHLILEDMDNFLIELGEGFAYIKSEYKIKLGDRYNYIDLLLYNYRYNCFVVIEFKVTELKKEYIGQIQTYMNYIDKNVRNINQDKTIGIIICKKDNQFIMEYCSDKRIYRTTYELV